MRGKYITIDFDIVIKLMINNNDLYEALHTYDSPISHDEFLKLFASKCGLSVKDQYFNKTDILILFKIVDQSQYTFARLKYNF